MVKDYSKRKRKGSISKSTKFTMLKSLAILGDYFCQINADAFTQQPKSANATSELLKIKGTRVVFCSMQTAASVTRSILDSDSAAC